MEKPGIYLHEISRDLQQTTANHISEATICRFLQKAGFTRTKIQHVALQWNEELRARYAAEIQLYQADLFVFVDRCRPQGLHEKVWIQSQRKAYKISEITY